MITKSHTLLGSTAVIAGCALFGSLVSCKKSEPTAAWTTDFAAAQAEAKSSGRDLMLEFTGSDWCTYCIVLEREVLSKEAFHDFATPHYVLVKLDYPQNKSKQSEAEKQQNKELDVKYGIEEYPTIFLADPDGRPYAAMDVIQEGVPEFNAHLTELMGKKAARDAAFAKAATATGVDKAQALLTAIDAMPLDFDRLLKFYAPEIAELKANDPDDTTGFAMREAAYARMLSFQKEIEKLDEADDLEGVLTAATAMENTPGLNPISIQQVILTRSSVLAELERTEEAIAELDRAIAIAPDSEMIPFIEDIKSSLTIELEETKGE